MPKERWNTHNFWAVLGVSIRYCPHCRNKKQWNGLWSQPPPAFQPLSALGLCRSCKVLPNQHSCNGVRENMGTWGRRPLPMWWLDWVHCKWGNPGCRGAENPRVGETCPHYGCLQNSCCHPRNTLSLNIFFFKLNIPKLTHFPVILVKKPAEHFRRKCYCEKENFPWQSRPCSPHGAVVWGVHLQS